MRVPSQGGAVRWMHSRAQAALLAALLAGYGRPPMRRFTVHLLLGFEQRPSRDEQAFLGELKARVEPWGIADLLVVIDVEAPDMAAALGRAQELVVDRLGADLLSARVTIPDHGVRPGSLWQRWRRRR